MPRHCHLSWHQQLKTASQDSILKASNNVYSGSCPSPPCTLLFTPNGVACVRPTTACFTQNLPLQHKHLVSPINWWISLHLNKEWMTHKLPHWRYNKGFLSIPGEVWTPDNLTRGWKERAKLCVWYCGIDTKLLGGRGRHGDGVQWGMSRELVATDSQPTILPYYMVNTSPWMSYLVLRTGQRFNANFGWNQYASEATLIRVWRMAVWTWCCIFGSFTIRRVTLEYIILTGNFSSESSFFFKHLNQPECYRQTKKYADWFITWHGWTSSIELIHNTKD